MMLCIDHTDGSGYDVVCKTCFDHERAFLEWHADAGLMDAAQAIAQLKKARPADAIRDGEPTERREWLGTDGHDILGRVYQIKCLLCGEKQEETRW